MRFGLIWIGMHCRAIALDGIRELAVGGEQIAQVIGGAGVAGIDLQSPPIVPCRVVPPVLRGQDIA